MTKAQYADLLKSPSWEKRRKQILKRDNHTCQECFKRPEILHVHHRYYLSGKMPWDYPNNALVTLCPACHKKAHENKHISEFTKKNAKEEIREHKKKQQKQKKNHTPKKHKVKVKQEQPLPKRKRRPVFDQDFIDRRNEARKRNAIYWTPEYQQSLKQAS